MPDERPSHYRILSTLGIVVFAFITGSFTAYVESFPFDPLLRPAFRAFNAFSDQLASRQKPRAASSLWRDARTSETGVTLHRRDRSSGGYTLYSHGGKSGAFLIDMSGEIVHRWEAPFHEVWDDPPHVDHVAPESMIAWVDSHMFSDGDVVGLYKASSASPWGYGLVRVDADSDVVWRAPIKAHHDFEVADDGRIYTLTHRIRTAGDAGPHIRSIASDNRVLFDYLVVLDADGEVRRRVSLLDAFIRADFPDLLRYPKIGERWDPLHANSVDIVGERHASHHDFLDPGDVLLSFRAFNYIAVLDPDAEEIVWAEKGPWYAQHDARFTPDGTVMLYDNMGGAGPTRGTRILEYSIEERAIVWSYGGTPEEPLWSKTRGHYDPLSNGNVLITESRGGRLLEVTRGGERAWEYYVPVREEVDGTSRLPTICAAKRYPPDYPTFELGG